MQILQTTLSLSLILFLAPAAGAKIVFSSYQFPESNIYVMDDDGSNITQITNYPHDEISPRWSPDGKQIAFLRDTNPSSTNNFNTFIMNVDGTNVRQLTNYRGNDKGLAFSPDGKKLLVSSLSTTSAGPLAGLYEIDIESGIYKRISKFIVEGIDWSPDGKQIVFVNTAYNLEVTESNIWLMNADGTNVGPLIPPIQPKRTVKREMSRWSPDGLQILYTETDRHVVERINEGGTHGITITLSGTFRYMIRNLNGVTQRLRIPESWIPHSIDWMDGQKSVLLSAYVDFEHWGEMHRTRWMQLYKYDIASGIITQLTHDDGSKSGADWVNDDESPVTSVSPAGKQTVRWGKLKKTYSD